MLQSGFAGIEQWLIGKDRVTANWQGSGSGRSVERDGAADALKKGKGEGIVMLDVEQTDTFLRVLLKKQEQIEMFLDFLDSGMEGFDIVSVYSTGQKRPYFYIIQKGTGKKLYLGSEKSDAVKKEKIRQLRAALKETLEYNRQQIQECMNRYRPYDVHSLEKYISPCLKDVPVNFVLNDNVQALWDWADQDYARNTAPFPKREIYALDGTRVRSKGEAEWYNDFKSMWVPMHYDQLMEFYNPKPGRLGPGDTIFKSPDFLIKCIDGTYIIVEHLGFLMDDNYSEDFRQKTQIYEANGFVLGVNFYVMSDDMNGGTDSRAIHEKVEEIKWKVYHGTGLEPPMREW